jgi:hypothetical protein
VLALYDRFDGVRRDVTPLVELAGVGRRREGRTTPALECTVGEPDYDGREIDSPVAGSEDTVGPTAP